MRLRQERYAGCLVVMLLCIAFLIGGMWGGLVGGGLVLWMLNPDQAAPIAQVAPVSRPTATPVGSNVQIIAPSPTASPVLLPTAPPSIEDAIETTLPSVVTVINYQDRSRSTFDQADKRIVGSGIIVDERGYIITNAHVVAQVESLNVILSTGDILSATLVLEHPDLDLAMLKVEAESLVVATWGDSSEVRLGQSVMAIGSALGDFPNSVTMGVVSGLNRALALGEHVVHGLIQTDAAINQGNSGGPLINLSGEIIGVNTFMIREDHNQGIAQGIGFAIPASSVKALVGVWLAQQTESGAKPLNIEEGAAPFPTASPTPSSGL